MIHSVMYDGFDKVRLDYEQLTEQQVDLIMDMIGTEGWQILKEKVLPRQQLLLAIDCTKPMQHITKTVNDSTVVLPGHSVDYKQGYYAGFKWCLEVIQQAEQIKSR